MLVSPYATTICQTYQNQTERLTNALLRADIEAPLPVLTTPMGNTIQQAFYIPPKDEYTDVPGFTQLVNIGKPNASKWVLDGRPYMRWEYRTDSYRLTAENDFSFQCTRLALTALAAEQPEAFYRLGDIPAKTFVRWITLALAQRFNLHLDAQLRVSIVVAYYYYTQLQSDRTLSTDDRQRLAQQVGRVTAVPVPTVLELADQLGDLTDAKALASQISQHAGTIRLSELKFADLFTIIAPSWVGVNARENCGVALEHLPTFIAMTYAALGEKSYRKAVLSRRAETTGRQQELKQFVDLVFRHVSSRFV
jgi:hypothetical protein